METFTSALKYNQKVTDETDQFRDGRVRTFSWTYLYVGVLSGNLYQLSALSRPQAHRRHPRPPRYIPPILVVLERNQLPGSFAVLVRNQHIKALAAMNIPAVPGQAIPLRLIAYLQYLFLHYLHRPFLYSAQFSSSRAGTRSNSRTLFVTSVMPSARA